MTGSALRWGICSAGKICQDFANAITSLPNSEHVLEAVAASSLERAKSFADKFNIAKSYGSYQELANDPDVDVIYIGSTNAQHYGHARIMLEGGKAVLCEKVLSTKPGEVQSLLALAKTKQLFLMEGLWSRFFPAYAAVSKSIEEGEIGEVRVCQSMLGVPIPDDPSFRHKSKDLGGGAIFDFGTYQIQLAQFIFKETPTACYGSGFINDHGVDISDSMTLKYTQQRLASMICSSSASLPNEAYICGTKGFIKIHSPLWAPTAITVNGKKREFELPKVARPMNYPNSEGLVYEAQEVRRCLMDGRCESDVITHAMSMELATFTNKLLQQIGYELPQDK